jgi:predicted dehydrogenase
VKALVVGGGSIGARHLRNLRDAGVTPLALMEPAADRRAEVERQLGSPLALFDSLAAALDWGPELTVIASPTHMHLEQAVEAARAGSHLFIEKPLSHSESGMRELVEEVESRDLISLVGCNMRFHPGPAMVRELLDRDAVGRVLFARVHAGSYLPGWRPTQDYTKSYSASDAAGGGCILDYIHELDLTRWYMGGVTEVFCMAGHLSSLRIDSEDVAMLVCRHEGGTLSQIHLDYVQRSYERGCQIVGEDGSIFWDFRAGHVRHYDAREDRWTSYVQPEGWEVNRMYVDELGHLLRCIESGTATVLPVREAAEVTRVALAARESARTGQPVAMAAVEV